MINEEKINKLRESNFDVSIDNKGVVWIRKFGQLYADTYMDCFTLFLHTPRDRVERLIIKEIAMICFGFFDGSGYYYFSKVMKAMHEMNGGLKNEDY